MAKAKVAADRGLEPSNSDFVIQVLHLPTGEIVEWAPGLKVEREFIAEIVNRVGAKKVGVGRTVKTVQSAVKDALIELFWDLKRQV